MKGKYKYIAIPAISLLLMYAAFKIGQIQAAPTGLNTAKARIGDVTEHFGSQAVYRAQQPGVTIRFRELPTNLSDDFGSCYEDNGYIFYTMRGDLLGGEHVLIRKLDCNVHPDGVLKSFPGYKTHCFVVINNYWAYWSYSV